MRQEVVKTFRVKDADCHRGEVVIQHRLGRMQLTICLQRHKAGVVASNWREQTKGHFAGQAM
jgi:hypothetical protein